MECKAEIETDSQTRFNFTQRIFSWSDAAVRLFVPRERVTMFLPTAAASEPAVEPDTAVPNL